MTASRERTAAGVPKGVSQDGATTRYLTMGDGPAVMVIPGGDASEC